MSGYAIVVDGLVVNMVAWDGVSDWQPTEGKAIQATDGVGIGWLYSDDSFTAPVPPELTQDEQIAQAAQRHQALRLTADAEIVWRQDAVDAGIATAEETAALAEWRKYRVLLMRVDTAKAPAIEWPTPPDAQAS